VNNPPPDPADAVLSSIKRQHMIEHARQIQLRVEEPEESEDGGGQFGDAHAIVDGGHPGSTRPGDWTPLTQIGQY